MEQIRIDRRAQGLRARHLETRARDRAAAAAPLRYAAPDPGSGIDEDLLSRIDALLDEQARTAEDEDEA